MLVEKHLQVHAIRVKKGSYSSGLSRVTGTKNSVINLYNTRTNFVFTPVLHIFLLTYQVVIPPNKM